jgi:hypothetical protein
MRKFIFTLLILVVIIAIQSFSEDANEDTTTQLAISNSHEGGVIFYLDETGEHGLMSSVADQGLYIEWGCANALAIGANGLEIGTRAQNTMDILTRCDTLNIAASLCDTHENDGYNDWLLPSKNELDALYQQRMIVEDIALEQEGGAIFYDSQYGSSSHESGNTVWIQYFTTFGNTGIVFKDTEHYVRAIRSF